MGGGDGAPGEGAVGGYEVVTGGGFGTTPRIGFGLVWAGIHNPPLSSIPRPKFGAPPSWPSTRPHPHPHPSPPPPSPWCALSDIATASAASLEALQSRLDAGLGQVAAAVDAARAGVEDREAALRAQINGALGKVRAYARDMEEGLEQERLRLEEVVKLEIRARQQSGDALKEALEAGVAKVRGGAG